LLLPLDGQEMLFVEMLFLAQMEQRQGFRIRDK
jgi:hypothetical protein